MAPKRVTCANAIDDKILIFSNVYKNTLAQVLHRIAMTRRTLPEDGDVSAILSTARIQYSYRLSLPHNNYLYTLFIV